MVLDMNKIITLYHGSEFVVDKVKYGYGKKNNDYGLGFYCTENIELAKEWAVDINHDGYANVYEINLDGLKILDLSSSEYNTLHWITILLENRVFNVKNEIAYIGRKYLLENYKIDISSYDIIIGYRADDSYFTFAQSFLNNTISLRRLSEALKYGDLGMQTVLISKEAIERIKYIDSIKSNADIYYPLRLKRNEFARRKFLLNKSGDIQTDDLFLSDIMRGGIYNDSCL